MPEALREIFRRRSRPLEPTPTDERPVLRKVAEVRAVLFDLYGTLLISASGEVGTARGQAKGPAVAPQRALAEAFEAVGIPAAGEVGEAVELLFSAIEASHEESRRAGIDHPEVDILVLWRGVLGSLARRGLIEQPGCESVDLRRLAVEYEARANPCWPMPHLRECLQGLCRGGLALGIVSNAQFYTPLLLEALLGGPAERWGFDPRLQYYSYRHGRAKPGTALYEMAAEALRSRQIAGQQVLYVGNDMLNDVLPALKVGFRTALFAGDARSLRRREGDRRLAGIRPDLVLTDLRQLVECMIVE